MNKQRITFFLAVWIIPVLFLFCSNDYNPFSDQSKARAKITYKTFNNMDTLSIFTTETLMVSLAIRELIDSFSVIAPSNRRTNDTVIVRKTPGQVLSYGPYTYLVSMTDTGWKTISINTYRSNGEHVPQELSVYCRSPLNQNDITGVYGESIQLSATPVGDADVIYNWDFGNGLIVSSPRSTIKTAVKMLTRYTFGTLWVSDPADSQIVSPRKKFNYQLSDNTAPVIMYANQSYLGQDTIRTGDLPFYFKVKIYDPAQVQPVCSTSINGTQFDINDAPFYVRVFDRLDTIKNVFKVTVSSVDNLDNRQKSEKTFWLGYSDTLGHSKGITITVEDPKNDLSVCSERDKVILGTVEDYAHDSIALYLKLFVNDVPTGQSFSAKGKYKVLWNIPPHLNDGMNRIKFIAYSLAGDSLAEKSISIVYDPGHKDSAPPVIFEVMADDKKASFKSSDNSYVAYVTQDRAALRIVAFDEGSAVDSLIVKGHALSLAPQGYGLFWYDTVSVTHSLSENEFPITAKDKAGNSTSAKLSVYKNNIPEIIESPPNLQQIPPDSAFSFPMKCSDNDRDNITFRKIVGPVNFTVSQNGDLAWRPTIADTGLFTVVIGIWDGFQDTSYSFNVSVKTLKDLPLPILFDKQNIFCKAYLEVGKDTLKLDFLTLNDANNTSPTFSVFKDNRSVQRGTARQYLWIPDTADVGKHSLKLKVSDNYSRTDSMLFSTTVVPPNRPCTLLVSRDINWIDDTLDLSGVVEPQTLSFSVKDPDIAGVEQITARILMHGNEAQTVLDSTRKFKLILDPKNGAKTKDSIGIFISDIRGHRDSIILFITYVGLKKPGFSGKIVLDTRSSDALINAPVYGFPLLVRLDTTFFTKSMFYAAGLGGANVRFTSSTGTQLPYQIERWDIGAFVAEIWVKVDVVQPNNDVQYVTMSWDSAPSNNSKGTAVFDSSAGYVGVWHLNDGLNSALARYNLTPFGGPSQSCRGVIATADSFSSGKYLSAGVLPTIQQVSLSAWVNSTQWVQFGKIICKGWNTYSYPWQIFSLQNGDKNTDGAVFYVSLSTQKNNSFSARYADSLKAKTWIHLAGTYDGQRILMYVNGIPVDTVFWTSGSIPRVPTNTQPWTIGGWSQKDEESFSGKIDEARIFDGVWTPDYIKLCYVNQSPGSNFLQFK
jgi:hypothetical protein